MPEPLTPFFFILLMLSISTNPFRLPMIGRLSWAPAAGPAGGVPVTEPVSGIFGTGCGAPGNGCGPPGCIGADNGAACLPVTGTAVDAAKGAAVDVVACAQA